MPTSSRDTCGVLDEPLPVSVESPRMAREMSRAWLRQRDLGDLVESVGIVVSELVANAVLHGGGDVRLRLAATAGEARIEVFDSNPVFGRIPETPTRAHGRGLQLVEAFSSNWGSEGTSEGKMTWAEVAPRS